MLLICILDLHDPYIIEGVVGYNMVSLAFDLVLHRMSPNVFNLVGVRHI